jgi:hypothetical protein
MLYHNDKYNKIGF